MSERRWGRVTVEGWIEQAPGWVKVWSGTTSCVGPLASTFGEGGPVSVEFLPEPVTFKDGDVVGERGGNVYVRRSGWWDVFVRSDGYEPLRQQYEDSDLAMWLGHGTAYRLVPEGNDG